MSGHEDSSQRAFTIGKWAGVLFVFALLAFVAESQLTQYVQSSLGFRQPYFVFYCVHSAFFIIFPLHLSYLLISTKHTPRAYIRGLTFTVQQHVPAIWSDRAGAFPTWGFARLVVCLSVVVSIPALLWFIAVALSPLTDVTALWNTNAFFAYVLTVKLLGLKWEVKRLAPVLLATAGAVAVVYGSSTASSTTAGVDSAESPILSKPLVGDLLTLVASVVYGVYQVMYKMYAALPNDPDELGFSPDEPTYEPIHDTADDSWGNTMPNALDMVYPPPFGLYANLLTASIGVCTFFLLWIPIPLLHLFGVEPFSLPTDIKTISVIAAISLSGVIFNAGLMILLGVWGPIVTSVGNLLTIVLVFLSDIIFGGAVDIITVWSVLGSGAIVAAFGILALT